MPDFVNPSKNSPIPVTRIDEDGYEVVVTQWVKILVKTKGDMGWEKYHSRTGNFKKLDGNDQYTLVAFRRPIYKDEPLPHHIEECNTYEIEKLNKMQ